MTSSFLVDSGARLIHCNAGKVKALPYQRVYSREQQYVGLRIKLDLKFFLVQLSQALPLLAKIHRVIFSHSLLPAALRRWLPSGTLK